VRIVEEIGDRRVTPQADPIEGNFVRLARGDEDLAGEPK
jgi:hypothetical protein